MIRLCLVGLFGIVALCGCSTIEDLRRSVHDDSYMLKKRPANRAIASKNIPAPATVLDNRLEILSGTPVDLSGTRARSHRLTREEWNARNLRNENSLWSSHGQANYFFARNKLKMPGDLITVLIEEDLRKDMVEQFKYLLPPEYRHRKYRVPGLSKEQEKSNRKVASTETTEQYSSEDRLTAEVLERYPNGNLRIRAVKRIPFREKLRDVEVTAIVRGNDISAKDEVKSSAFFEHKVELYQ